MDGWEAAEGEKGERSFEVEVQRHDSAKEAKLLPSPFEQCIVAGRGRGQRSRGKPEIKITSEGSPLKLEGEVEMDLRHGDKGCEALANADIFWMSLSVIKVKWTLNPKE